MQSRKHLQDGTREDMVLSILFVLQNHCNIAEITVISNIVYAYSHYTTIITRYNFIY